MKTSHSIILLFSIISCIGFGLTSSELMKFAFAQSDENVMNQTDSENIIGLNATSTSGLNATSTSGLNATDLDPLF